MKKRAILLLNMGGPNNLDEVEVFLKNMFNDKRIIPAPQPIRALIAKLIIFKRLKESKSNYEKIGGKSPIVDYTNALIESLQKNVDASVYMVMRYTPPFAKDVVEELQNVEEIYAIPLYPHYSKTTTLSSMEDLQATLTKYKIAAKLKTIDAYYNDPSYNRCIVQRIKEALNGDNPSDFELVFSAHGLPQKIIDQGDLYQKHLKYNLFHARRELLKEGIEFHKTHLAYQSRLGPAQWIKPYLETKLVSLKKRKVILYPLAFTIDNSETEYELLQEYKEIADELGFEEYRVAKAPNDHPLFVKSLTDIYESMKKQTA